jgi:hypothetical protein
MIKPVKVKILYSESRYLHQGEEMTFTGFECAAYGAAMRNQQAGDKVDVLITFDNGEEYKCKLCLSQAEDKGFKQHCQQIINYTESGRFANENYKEAYLQLAAGYKQIKWS